MLYMIPSLSQIGLGKLDVHKNQLKWIKYLIIRPWTIKLLKKHRGKSWHWLLQWYSGYDTKNTTKKEKIRQVELYWTTMFLQSRKQSTEWKGNLQYGRNICTQCDDLPSAYNCSGFFHKPVLCQELGHISLAFSKFLWVLQYSVLTDVTGFCEHLTLLLWAATLCTAVS